MRFTCTSWSWPLLSFEQVMRCMSLLEFHAIDVGAFAGFVHFEPEELATRPRENGAQLVDLGRRYGFVFSDLFVTFGNDLVERSVNFPDPDVREHNRRMFQGIAGFCAMAGIPGMSLSPGVAHQQVGRRASLDLAVEELGRLAAIGQAAGLRVSFEPHLDSITESPEDTLKVLAAVPGLKLTLDCSHFVAQGYTVSAIEPLLAHAGHFHVRQSRPGVLQARDDDGEIDFERVLEALQSTGYDGWVAMEYEWNAWKGNNRADVLSETILLKRRLARFEQPLVSVA